MLLSSGTEDYFLGTYYFNKGAYTTPIAGVTHLNRTGGHGADFSGYRVHTDEPLVFDSGVSLTWRNGDPAGCDLSVSPKGWPSVVVSSVVLFYEM
eukprot:1935449-Prymnesium_polylepis.1